jgi:hypothetical protein
MQLCLTYEGMPHGSNDTKIGYRLQGDRECEALIGELHENLHARAALPCWTSPPPHSPVFLRLSERVVGTHFPVRLSPLYFRQSHWLLPLTFQWKQDPTHFLWGSKENEGFL